jgi:hypothetical protein
LPFILTNDGRTAYAEAVIKYPFLISDKGKDLQSGLPNIGFSGIWSAMYQMGNISPTIYSITNPLEIILMLLVIYVATRKKIPLQDVSLLGFTVFLIGSKYVWANFTLPYIPLAGLVFFSHPRSRERTILAGAILVSGISYRIVEGAYALLYGLYPPSYAVPDLLFFASLVMYLVWQTWIRSRRNTY